MTIETVADALKFLNDHEKRFFASNREIARLEKRNAALERVARGLRDSLLKLANEASGFLSMADWTVHGHTNIAVLANRIEEGRAALVAAGAVLKEAKDGN